MIGDIYYQRKFYIFPKVYNLDVEGTSVQIEVFLSIRFVRVKPGPDTEFCDQMWIVLARFIFWSQNSSLVRSYDTFCYDKILQHLVIKFIAMPRFLFVNLMMNKNISIWKYFTLENPSTLRFYLSYEKVYKTNMLMEFLFFDWKMIF